MSDRSCPSCGNPNDENAIFCSSCGTRIGGGNCQCGAKLPPEANACPSCGRSAERLSAPEMGRRGKRREDAGIRWVRTDQIVAGRIAPSDLLGRLRSGLEVQHGTRALLFLGGRYVGTLSPGRHTLESVWQKLGLSNNGEPVAVVVDDGEMAMAFQVSGLFSKDDHRCLLHAEASVRLADPEIFLANLFRDRSRFDVADLTKFLEGEIFQSLRELVKDHVAEDLLRGRLRTDVEMELLSRWRATLERSGFVLNRFRVLRFELPGLEEAEAIRADTGDLTVVGEAGIDDELATIRLEGDRFVRTERLKAENELNRTKASVDRLERRQPFLERLLSAENLEDMSRLRSDEEWRKFAREIDRDHLLTDHEWEQLKANVAATTATAEVKRQFLFDRLLAISQADLDELKLRSAYQLKLLEMKGDTDVVREQIGLERARLDSELDSRSRVFVQELDERKRRFEHEQTEQKGVADLQIGKVERLAQLHQLELDRESARKVREQVSTAELEIRKLAQEGEVFSSMNADQILAMAVARDPARAAEIAESFRAMKSGDATARERELYERIISEVKDSNERAQRLDHEKFKLSVDADARHRASREALNEQEKDRLEGVAVAGLTADDKKKIHWAYCDLHGLKHQAERDCPMCRADRKS